jgi:hypothetical protein
MGRTGRRDAACTLARIRTHFSPAADPASLAFAIGGEIGDDTARCDLKA